MAYTFTVQRSFNVSAHEIILSNFTTLQVKRISDSRIVYQTALSGSPAIRVINSNYQIGQFTTSDPVFERKINENGTPHTMIVTQVNADYCFIGTTNDSGNTVTYQYKLNLCVLQISKAGSMVTLTSPVCPGQSGCGNCFSEY
jgi:hypothetical protein